MTSRWLGGAVLTGMWLFAAAVFGRLPARIPTHWNLAGEVDGWMPKMPGAFVGPASASLVFAILVLMPQIDPRRSNVARSTGDRQIVANAVVLFLALLEVLSLGVALGWPIDMTAAVTGSLGLLMVCIGNYLPRIRSNWWIGIRTPWTMDDERVWRDTHRLGGRLFVLGGLALLPLAAVRTDMRGILVLAVILTAALVPAVYSFIAWRRTRAS